MLITQDEQIGPAEVVAYLRRSGFSVSEDAEF